MYQLHVVLYLLFCNVSLCLLTLYIALCWLNLKKANKATTCKNNSGETIMFGTLLEHVVLVLCPRLDETGVITESKQWCSSRGLLSEGPSNITVLPRARLSDSKDRRCENKVWLDLEKGAVVEKEEKSFLSLPSSSFLSVHYYLWACDRLSLGKASKQSLGLGPCFDQLRVQYHLSFLFHFFFSLGTLWFIIFWTDLILFHEQKIWMC